MLQHNLMTILLAETNSQAKKKKTKKQQKKNQPKTHKQTPKQLLVLVACRIPAVCVWLSHGNNGNPSSET